MIRIRKAKDRGHFDHGWLKTWHSFSFADYQDPRHEQFRALRVINEDIIAPGRGFGTHGHRDMEIITYPLAGSLEHRDSLGHGGVLKRDRIQRMRAGTGIRHSEANPDPDRPLHLFQIWLFPKTGGLQPAYEDRSFDPALAMGRWQLLVSPDGAEGSLDMAQDAHLWRVFLQPGEEVALTLPERERFAYVQLAGGEVELRAVPEESETSEKGRRAGDDSKISFVNDGPVANADWSAAERETSVLRSSDGAALSGVRGLSLRALAPTEVLVFGLA